MPGVHDCEAGLLVLDSQAGWRAGARSTLRVRALDEAGAELDRIELVRN